MKTLEMLSRMTNPVATEMKSMVNQILQANLPAAVSKGSFIINDIANDFHIIASRDISPIVGGMLNTFLTYASNSCIRISAERIHGNMVQICICDNNNNQSYAVACALQKMIPMAEKIGANLNVTNRRQRITSLSLIFPVEALQELHLPNLLDAA